MNFKLLFIQQEGELVKCIRKEMEYWNITIHRYRTYVYTILYTNQIDEYYLIIDNNMQFVQPQDDEDDLDFLDDLNDLIDNDEDSDEEDELEIVKKTMATTSSTIKNDVTSNKYPTALRENISSQQKIQRKQMQEPPKKKQRLKDTLTFLEKNRNVQIHKHNSHSSTSKLKTTTTTTTTNSNQYQMKSNTNNNNNNKMLQNKPKIQKSSSERSKEYFHMPFFESNKKDNGLDRSGRVREDYEEFSKLRIKNRASGCGILDLRRHMKNFEYVDLQRLREQKDRLSNNKSLEWVTIGIVQGHSPIRTSSNGRKFRILTIGNIKNITVTLFLFGQAFEEHSDTRLGTMVILVNSSIMAAKEKKSFSLSVNSKGQMMKIGLSKDYGICKGTRKSDGKKCTMAIDTRYGKFCEYHLAGQFKKSAAGRMDLAGSSVVRGNINRANYGQNNKQRKGKGFLNSKNYGGGYGATKNSNGGTTAFFGIKRQNLSSGTYHHKNSSLSGGHGNFSVGQRGNVTSSAEDILRRKRHGERFANKLQSDMERKGLDRLGVGQRNVAKFFNVQGNGTSNQTTSYRNPINGNSMARRVMNGGIRQPRNLQQQQQQQSQYRKNVKLKRPRVADPLGAMFKQAKVDTNKAIAERLKAAGIVIEAPNPNDPNGIRKMATKNKKKLQRAGIVKKKSLKNQVFESNKSRGNDMVHKLGKSKKSIHEDLGNKLLEKERDYKMEKLQEREGIVEKLSSRTEMEVKAYMCQTCNNMYEQLSNMCKNNHDWMEVKVMKYCFECKNGNCGWREFTLGKRFLKIPCKKCKNTSWRRTSFHKVRKDKEDKFDITKVKKNASKFLTGRYQAGK